jgi:hypothetical protein
MALVLYLRFTHAISYRRLRACLSAIVHLRPHLNLSD